MSHALFSSFSNPKPQPVHNLHLSLSLWDFSFWAINYVRIIENQRLWRLCRCPIPIRRRLMAPTTIISNKPAATVSSISLSLSLTLLSFCWGPFFRPTWHYFIGNPYHINILLIFWVNLFKTQNKLISHSTIWIRLTWPARSLLQEADSWSTFPLHQLGS